MESEVYTDPGVTDRLDTLYYPVSMNAESRNEVTFDGQVYTEEELAQEWGVTSYPSMMFINPDGELVARESGYIDPMTYRQMLDYIGTHAFEDQSFESFTES